MMQITPVQAAPQPAAADPAITKGSSDQFTPHLEKAVTAVTRTTSDSSPAKPPHTASQPHIKTPAPGATDPIHGPVLPEDIAPESAMDQTGEKLFPPVELLSESNKLPLASAKQPIPVQPPAQNSDSKASGTAESEELTEQKTETPINISIITTQPADQNANMQAPGKGVFLEIRAEGSRSLTAEKGFSDAHQDLNKTAFISKEIVIQSPGGNKENPSFIAENDLAAAPQDKNGTPFTAQEIKMQSAERNPDIEAGRMVAAKEAAWQKPTTMPASNNVNLQVPVKQSAQDSASLNSPYQATGNQSPLLPELKSETVSSSQVPASPLAQHKTDFPQFSEPSNSSLNQPFKFDLTGVQAHRANSSSPGIGQNQTLLQQLQQIIESGNETGTVTIEATASSYSFQYRGAGGAKLGDIASSQLNQPGGTGEKNTPKIPALRQDLLGQYFDAKLSSNEKGDPTQNPQTNDPQNQSHSQQVSGSQQQHPSVLPDQANSFQNISSALQDIQTNHSQSITRQVTLPSGTVVDEDNVIQQVAERFQINNRANDIKLNLKLHPAELGELKIDLTLKEGSIKGNVVVQSQQIQEIIEKNMLKLRSVLEDQGFTVEEIVVTSESESVTDFELFEQHLSQQNELIPSFTDPQQENDFEGALENAVVQSVESSTGVNIKA